VRVLVVEDDAAMRDLLVRCLREEGIRPVAVSDGLAAEEEVAQGGFDAILLDVVLPGDDGFTVCRRFRARGVDAPVIMLTGRGAVADRVQGLDGGADDYLAKPFAIEELLARLRALTRRGRSHQKEAILRYGPIELDQHDKVVRLNGETVVMTATEFHLLEYLMLHPERPVPREELALHVWGDRATHRSNVIDVYVGYVRKKLKAAGHPLLRTIRHFGYCLTDKPPAHD